MMKSADTKESLPVLARDEDDSTKFSGSISVPHWCSGLVMKKRQYDSAQTLECYFSAHRKGKSTTRWEIC